MRTHPAAIRRLAANPRFEIGNHSWSHPDLRKLSREQIGAEVRRTLAELERLTGRTTRLFRLPFGYAEQQTLQVLNDLGQRIIQWDLVTGDPDPGVLADNIVATVKTRAHNGSILIMHANGRGHHTAEALPLVIEALRGRGFSFATISGLLGAPVADSARFRAGP
jgi:peptidoglycan/xylan/chitin deacetylase (PgdA/CDA1 family)